MKNLLSIFAISLLLQHSASAQIWSNDITGTDPSSSNPYTTGDQVNANITVSGIRYSPGIYAYSSDDQFAATGFAPFSPQLNANQYFEFTLSPMPGYSISIENLNLNVVKFSGGPNMVKLAASTDNYASTIGSFFNSSGSAEHFATIPINATYNETITFRLYAYGAAQLEGVMAVNNFSFTGSVNQTPLPLTLLSFDAKAHKGNALLNWRCVNQKNITKFEIQSGNGVSFKKTGTVHAQNTKEEIAYSFNEALPGGETTAFYRLKILETDGKFSYSPIVQLSITSENQQGTIAYPNPVKDLLYLKELPENCTIKVSDIYGRTIWESHNVKSNEIKINTAGWSNGIFMIQVNDSFLTRIVKK